MEAMEVDPPVLVAPPVEEGGGSDVSGSSTEEEEGGPPPAGRPPPTWAFSQRAGGATAPPSTAGGGPRRRRLRQGLRVHYPSQTAAPPRGFSDFLLRVPAASAAEAASSEASESEEEGGGPAGEGGGPPAAAEPPNMEPPPPQQRDGPTDPSAATETETGPPTDTQQQDTQSAPPAVEEGEGDICTICFESWTTAGEHRLAALRCGHLFGFTCIQRWLKAQGPAAKCPQCNKKAKRSDIVLLYAPKLRALDNSEQESLKKSLQQEQSLRRKAELESAQYKLKLQVVTNQYGQAQQELQELRALMAGRGSLPSPSPSPSPSSSSLGGAEGARGGQYSFSRAVLLSQAGGARVLSYCPPLSCLLASQPSPHSTLVPGCGVKKVSVVNMKASQYVPIHSKQIRGLSFNRQNDSLLLSAALDSTLKLTSLLTNTVVQTYNAGKPVWSCCWSLDNSNFVYAGLSNGSVLVYDTRDTSTHIQELAPLRYRCPVASLCFVPRSPCFPGGGVLAGSLEGGCFWEQSGGGWRPHSLPLEAGITDIQLEGGGRHCLVTYRPGRSQPSLRCVLMALNRTPQQDSVSPLQDSVAPLQDSVSPQGDSVAPLQDSVAPLQDSVAPLQDSVAPQGSSVSCSAVQTFTAGSSCKLLTKNAVFRSPDGAGTLVCAGDEASNSTMVWDAGTGSLLQKLPADLPVLDIAPFSVGGQHFLASLTEKMIKLYRWE